MTDLSRRWCLHRDDIATSSAGRMISSPTTCNVQCVSPSTAITTRSSSRSRKLMSEKSMTHSDESIWRLAPAFVPRDPPDLTVWRSSGFKQSFVYGVPSFTLPFVPEDCRKFIAGVYGVIVIVLGDVNCFRLATCWWRWLVGKERIMGILVILNKFVWNVS
ncbi:hypothetical protein TIFTF001_027938 [Ficus carica]|uniref:Uncharacterized protein n=1 Tax=Ficus carica TaxID=3494 RepID=A0AA88J0H5_FICCA|nr:hypothetical protein TIFTF001_027938 [Ficus carica]